MTAVVLWVAVVLFCTVSACLRVRSLLVCFHVRSLLVCVCVWSLLVCCNRITPGVKKRKFTRWGFRDTEKVKSYFGQWVTGVNAGLPTKKEIQQFLQLQSGLNYDWMTVRNKVLNERMSFAKRRKLQLENLQE